MRAVDTHHPTLELIIVGFEGHVLAGKGRPHAPPLGFDGGVEKIGVVHETAHGETDRELARPVAANVGVGAVHQRFADLPAGEVDLPRRIEVAVLRLGDHQRVPRPAEGAQGRRAEDTPARGKHAVAARALKHAPSFP